MNYYLITKIGEYFLISQTERDAILRGLAQSDDSMIFIKSADMAIRSKSIERIVRADELHKFIREQNVDMRSGRLHDGTQVVKVGGRWFLSDGIKNENGFLEKEIDPAHYREITNNTVIPEHLWASVQSGRIPQLVLKEISSLGREESVSQFAKELAPRFSMLDNKGRTEAQEESAREIRKSQ